MATNRRSFLVAGGTAAVTALAGCTGDDSGPEDAVEEFYSRVDDGDVEGAQDMLHADADIEVTASNVEVFEEPDIEVTQTAVVGREDDDDEAIVEARVAVSGEVDGEEIDEEETTEILLRQSEGDWLLVEESSQSQEVAPQASLGLDCDNGAVVVEHRGGDQLFDDEVVDQGDGSFDADLSVGESNTLVESPDGETNHMSIHEPSDAVIFQGEIDCS